MQTGEQQAGASFTQPVSHSDTCSMAPGAIGRIWMKASGARLSEVCRQSLVQTVAQGCLLDIILHSVFAEMLACISIGPE